MDCVNTLRARCHAQGHLDTRTSNLPVTSQPALPPSGGMLVACGTTPRAKRSWVRSPMLTAYLEPFMSKRRRIRMIVLLRKKETLNSKCYHYPSVVIKVGEEEEEEEEEEGSYVLMFHVLQQP